MSAKVTSPWDDHYMAPAFYSFVFYAFKNRMGQYRAETCDTYQFATGIEAMIDAAAGRDVAFVQRFIDWCVTQYGTPEDLGEAE